MLSRSFEEVQAKHNEGTIVPVGGRCGKVNLFDAMEFVEFSGFKSCYL